MKPVTRLLFPFAVAAAALVPSIATAGSAHAAVNGGYGPLFGGRAFCEAAGGTYSETTDGSAWGTVSRCKLPNGTTVLCDAWKCWTQKKVSQPPIASPVTPPVKPAQIR